MQHWKRLRPAGRADVPAVGPASVSPASTKMLVSLGGCRQDHATTEVCHPGEGVSFAALVLQYRPLPGSQVERFQSEGSSRSLQERIEPPRSGDVIFLEFLDKQVELYSSMRARNARARTNGRGKGSRVTGIPYGDSRWLRLRAAGQSERQEASDCQRHASIHSNEFVPRHSSPFLAH